MKLIVGLGNPGKEYGHTRHNAGWDAVGIAAADMEATFTTKKEWRADVAETRVEDGKVLLVRPLTFMNLSGEAVSAIQQFFKIPLENILIVQDEMDFPPGRVAFSVGGGDAGHNGIASIRESLGSDAFVRLRIGIGRPVSPIKPEDYVLQRPTTDQKPAIEEAAQALQGWITEGTKKAMNLWNKHGS